jgi:YaiO family outer membrane protein
VKLGFSVAVASILSLQPLAVRAQEPTAYQAGVKARLSGRPEEAERLLRGWLATHPEDVDARVQLAYAELALGRLEDAEADFNAVLAKAPQYKDASDGLALVAAQRRSHESPARPTLALEGAWSDLNHGARDWYEASARLTAPIDPAASVDASGSYYRRFGVDDVELAGAVTARQDRDLWLRAQASVTPSADFRPRWGIGGGFDWRLAGGPSATVVTADVRYEDFPAQHVTTLSPGVMQYFAGGRAWLTVRGFGVFPEGRALRLGWMLRGDYQPRERYRLFAGVADGPDTDLGVVTNVTSLFGGVEFPIAGRISLTTSLAHEWRNVGSDRTELRAGIKAAL